MTNVTVILALLIMSVGASTCGRAAESEQLFTVDEGVWVFSCQLQYLRRRKLFYRVS